jgi:hypothetical protein
MIVHKKTWSSRVKQSERDKTAKNDIESKEEEKSRDETEKERAGQRKEGTLTGSQPTGVTN